MKLDRKSLWEIVGVFAELAVGLARSYADHVLDLHTLREQARLALDLSEENSEDIKELKKPRGAYVSPPRYK